MERISKELTNDQRKSNYLTVKRISIGNRKTKIYCGWNRINVRAQT